MRVVVIAGSLLACCAERALPIDGIGAAPAADMRSPTSDLASPPDLASALDLVPPVPKLVFTTSQSFAANLGGLSGADAKCQQLADAAGLNGTFKAWLSDSHESPSTRFVHATVPYQMVDGTLIADDWNQLVSFPGGVSVIHHEIDRDERGMLVPPIVPAPCSWNHFTHPVWTGTTGEGTLHTAMQTCSDWTTIGHAPATWGDAHATMSWSISCSGDDAGCTLSAYLYCFQQ